MLRALLLFYQLMVTRIQPRVPCRAFSPRKTCSVREDKVLFGGAYFQGTEGKGKREGRGWERERRKGKDGRTTCIRAASRTIFRPCDDMHFSNSQGIRFSVFSSKVIWPSAPWCSAAIEVWTYHSVLNLRCRLTQDDQYNDQYNGCCCYYWPA